MNWKISTSDVTAVWWTNFTLLASGKPTADKSEISKTNFGLLKMSLAIV